MNPFLTPFPEPAPALEIEVEIEVDAPPAANAPGEPTTRDLVQRALSEPPRAMWPSLHATPDPILQAKALPGVAERREKLTRVVKAGLAGCALLCAAAIVAGFIGGTSTAAAAGPARVARAAVVEKEGLEQVTVTKAHAATTAHAAKAPKKAHKPAKKAKARRGRR